MNQEQDVNNEKEHDFKPMLFSHEPLLNITANGPVPSTPD